MPSNESPTIERPYEVYEIDANGEDALVDATPHVAYAQALRLYMRSSYGNTSIVDCQIWKDGVEQTQLY